MDSDVTLTIEPAEKAELDASQFTVHPYERSRDKVALVGMAKTSRHLVPWEDDDFEVWGLNEAYNFKITDPEKHPYFKRWTRWFQVHPEWDFMRVFNFNDPDHANWVSNKDNRRRTDFPIYALEQYDYPGFVRYPALDIWNSFKGNEELARYFQSSFDFMCALAVWMEFKEIHAFGFEMRSEEEYRHQRPSAHLWVGAAMGRGIIITEPEGSHFLNQGLSLYGYEKVPGVTAMHTEIKLNQARRMVNQEQAKLNNIIGQKMKIVNEMRVIKNPTPKFVDKKNREVTEFIEKEMAQRNILNSWMGQMAAFDSVLRDIKGLPEPSKVQIIQPKEGVKVVDMLKEDEKNKDV